MINQSYRAQYILAAAADHQFLRRIMDGTRKLFLGEETVNITQEFDELRQMLTHKLPEHFAYEEKQVFPALLADHPPAEVEAKVMELCEDHQTLLQEARILKPLLSRGTYQCTASALSNKLINFFEMLEKHALKEDALFGQEQE